MAREFNCIGLFGKYADKGVSTTLQGLGHYLRERGVRVMLDEATARVWPDHGMEVADRESIGAGCDLAVVVGGDGTLLNVVRSLASHDIAVLGINLGRLGFLADILPEHVEEKLAAIIAGQYQQEERFLLHCTVMRDGEVLSESDAFNDVVVHKWEVARMIELETRVDSRCLNTMRADGLIVSTPTGSTAYALSGGGPILEPTLNAIVLVPICPHTLSNRPIVVAGDSRIEVVVGGGSDTPAQVTCDGQINLGLVAGDRVLIRKKEHPVRLIHPVEHDHYHILRAKLGWG